VRRGALGAGIGLVAGLLVLAPVLGRGVVLSYDMVFVPDPPLTGAVLGSDGSVPRAVPTELLADLLARVLPVVVVQQGLLLAVFVLAGAGAARLVPGLPGAAGAALAYAWTPYVGERLLIGHWTFLLGYAVLPWVVGAALSARRGGSLRPLLLWLAAAAAAGSTSALLATPTALLVLLLPTHPPPTARAARSRRRTGSAASAPAATGEGPRGARETGSAAPPTAPATTAPATTGEGARAARESGSAASPTARAATGEGPRGARESGSAAPPTARATAGEGECGARESGSAAPPTAPAGGRGGVGWRAAGVVVGCAVVVNLPWIVPAVVRPGGVPADPSGVAAFAARADTPLGVVGSLLTLGGIWNPATVPAARDSPLAVLALVGILVALALGLRAVLAESVGLVVAGAAGLVLAAAGAIPGAEAVLRAVVVHVPGGGLLRDGQKLLAPTVLVVALAAGHATRRLARTGRTAPWAVLLAALPVLTLPTLAWGVAGRLTAADYPQDWLALRAAVHAAPPGAVAALPWGTYRRLDWAGDRVVLDPLPRLLDRRTLADDALPVTGLTVRGEDARAARVSAALAAGGQLPAVLRDAGARYAAVDRTQPGAPAAERALAGLPVRFSSPDLLLVDLPGPTVPIPPDRPWIAVLALAPAVLAVGAAATRPRSRQHGRAR
jgi:hypothetical protein